MSRSQARYLTEAELLNQLISRVQTINRIDTVQTMRGACSEVDQLSNMYPQYSEHFNILLMWISSFENIFLKRLRSELRRWVAENSYVRDQVVFKRKFYTSVTAVKTVLQAFELHDRLCSEYDEISDSAVGPSEQQEHCFILMSNFIGEYDYRLLVDEQERYAEESNLEGKIHKVAVESMIHGIASILRRRGIRMAINVAASCLLAYVTGDRNQIIHSVTSNLQDIIEVSASGSTAATGHAAEEGLYGDNSPSVPTLRKVTPTQGHREVLPPTRREATGQYRIFSGRDAGPYAPRRDTPPYVVPRGDTAPYVVSGGDTGSRDTGSFNEEADTPETPTGPA